MGDPLGIQGGSWPKAGDPGVADSVRHGGIPFSACRPETSAWLPFSVCRCERKPNPSLRANFPANWARNWASLGQLGLIGQFCLGQLGSIGSVPSPTLGRRPRHGRARIETQLVAIWLNWVCSPPDPGSHLTRAMASDD